MQYVTRLKQYITTLLYKAIPSFCTYYAIFACSLTNNMSEVESAFFRHLPQRAFYRNLPQRAKSLEGRRSSVSHDSLATLDLYLAQATGVFLLSLV